MDYDKELTNIQKEREALLSLKKKLENQLHCLQIEELSITNRYLYRMRNHLSKGVLFITFI